MQTGARPEEIAQAKARADTSNAALLETRTGARVEEIAADQARLVAAEATLDQAKNDAERIHRLYAGGAIAKAEVDTADTQLRAATGPTRRDQERARSAEERLARKEDVAQAGRASGRSAGEASNWSAPGLAGRGHQGQHRHGGGGAGAGWRRSRPSLDELTVRAPRPSRVESLDLRPGDILGPSATAATLIEDDQLYVRIYVPGDADRSCAGGRRRCRWRAVDSFPGRSFAGVVEHVNMASASTPRRNLQTADEARQPGVRHPHRLARLEPAGATIFAQGWRPFVHVPR